MKYVALLRGINVGGHTQIRMDALRRAFASLGYRDVRTLLNSGNVVFASNETISSEGAHALEELLETSFGFHVDTILRPQTAIQAIVESNPFREIEVTPSTRLFVTFRGDLRAGANALIAPYRSPEGDFQLLRVTAGEICASLVLSPKRGTVDLMKVLEREFGKNITTRSWNTVVRIAAL
jgi:uncharacterized protein (DUF1697 family)